MVTLSTPNPELIRFSQNPVRIGLKRNSKKIRVRFRPFNEFLNAYPELSTSTAQIPITATDSVTGDSVTTNIDLF